ncbi:MAG: response regulator [Arcobacter sp.]|jgi:DNA-binding response OmpR family regulator|uniref:Two-component system response regulator n=1 Tax=Arcobacter defluvii TaxID=873191 RepID=A0AAE7BGD7_9BACT|nr:MULTISPECIES: response regulator [Arcobacter]MDY3200567.1 response regulator [Arcobacter sp.]QKF77446.1 two-component system response regulator [Arcobacter defluvii]RXI32095.1 DNA-binding response regulator [Arcobacter defluvii]BAK73291.1 two-component response regulator [Arcobacter sp. L]
MKKKKILIVEDESIVALDIKRTLEKLDYEITNTAFDYQGAINSVLSNKPDLILMDVNLGKSKDGIETAKKIKTFEDIPIIYLTAFSDEETINRAIQTKPVSYLIKPFKRDELKSNIMLGLYKNEEIEDIFYDENLLLIGENYYFNKKEDRLYFKSLPINLGSKEVLLLKILLESRGQIVTIKDLESLIWGENSISSSTLRTLIYRLRTKLEYKFVETIPYVGCRIC